ncbi:signal peptide peptidase SppA [Candidatus Poribacteria bacterium]|nr:signal peptide peptidase SppA [Candidatus Poribacteria bacterium]
MTRKRILTIAITTGIFLVILLIVISTVSVIISTNPEMYPGDKLAMVEITGPIYGSQHIVEYLHKYRDDPLIKGIILRINSPGGAVAPVQEIYKEITKINKHIIASMGSTAASGGYYIASAADHIFANPGTLTGSIGVIMLFSKWKGLMEKIGIDQNVVKSGKYKDSGSMYRDLTEEEREIFQSIVDDVHQQFVTAILEGRAEKELTREELETLADGRIFSGRQALEYKLVDELGDLSDAIDYAGKISGIEGEPKVVKAKPKYSLMDFLIKSVFGKKISEIAEDHAVLRYEMVF